MTKISNQYSLTNVLTADPVNGRVGIGTTSPTVPLDVVGAGKFSGALTGTSATFSSSVTATQATLSGSASDRLIMTRTGVGTYHLSISGDDRFSIYDPSADAERISITSTGNVGIGTSSPTSLFHAYGNLSANPITFEGNGSSNAWVRWKAGSSTSTWQLGASSGAFIFYDEYVNAERMRITSAGNVGIGTSTPAFPLTVNGNISSTNNSSNISTYFFSSYADPTTSYTYIQGDGRSSGYMLFRTNDAERMRITSGGNVGIGTSSPACGLHIVGVPATNSEAVYNLVLQDSSSYSSRLGSGISFGGYYNSNDITQTFASIKGIKENTTINNYAGALSFITRANGGNPTERMRITSGGVTTLYGTNNQTRLSLQNTDGASYTSFTEQEIRMWRPNDSGSYFTIATQALSGTWTGGGGAIVFTPLNTLRMTISATGNIGAPSGTNIYNASDARLKQNISQITYGLDAIAALNPVKFNWIDGFEPSEDGKDMLGFVAQEVQQVLPEAVELFGNDIVLNGETVTTPLRVNEKFIIPVLVKAIQEQQTQINELKALLNA